MLKEEYDLSAIYYKLTVKSTAEGTVRIHPHLTKLGASIGLYSGGVVLLRARRVITTLFTCKFICA